MKEEVYFTPLGEENALGREAGCARAGRRPSCSCTSGRQRLLLAPTRRWPATPTRRGERGKWRGWWMVGIDKVGVGGSTR
jgi:hypothetical protein